MIDTKHMMEIMQAHLDGKPIQYRLAGTTCVWTDIDTPSWQWGKHEYRVKEVNADYERGYNAALNDVYTILDGITEKHKLRAKDPFTRKADGIFAVSEMASDYVRYVRELGHELGRLEEEDAK